MEPQMNAIMTAATGYTEKDLTVFLRSVEQHCKNVAVFLIVFQEDYQEIEKLRQKYPFIKPVYVPRRSVKRFRRVYVWIAHLLKRMDYSQLPPLLQNLGSYPLHVVVERFLKMSELLRDSDNDFENVLLTDCRDVVLQKDPFELVNDKLVSGLEIEKIGNNSLNSYWVSSIYGEKFFNDVKDRKIICVGVILGPAREVQKYLDLFCSEVWKHLPEVIKVEFGPDTAVHDYIIYTDLMESHLVDNHSGFIATIGLEGSDQISKDRVNRSIQVEGVTPAIIHQYDRHSDLLEFFKEKYC